MDCVLKNRVCVIGLKRFEKSGIFRVFPDNLETGYPQLQIWAVYILFSLRLQRRAIFGKNELKRGRKLEISSVRTVRSVPRMLRFGILFLFFSLKLLFVELKLLFRKENREFDRD